MGPHIFEWFNSDVGDGTALTQILIGLCVVFLCLAIIIGLLMLLDLFFRFDCPAKISGLLHRGKKAASKASGTEKPRPAPVQAQPDVPADVDGETVAAIAAALSLVVTDTATGKPLPFVIRKIRHL